MNYAELTCTKFVDETFSKAPVPGGGGVASLVGALGVALGGMVCNLTTGKKKYAQYEEDIQRIMKEAEELKTTMMGMIDQDARNFLPLSKAYGLPTSTDEEKKYKVYKYVPISKIKILLTKYKNTPCFLIVSWL